MVTANIALPYQLKNQADSLIKSGYFASFSDLVRTSLRSLIKQVQYDTWLEAAKKDERQGKAIILKTKKDIDKLLS